MHLKLLQKRVIEKTAEATGDLIGNKIVNRITNVSIGLQQIISENDKETPKERYESLEKRQEIMMI